MDKKVGIMMITICPKCGDPREVKRKPKDGVVCKNCKTIPKRSEPLYRVCKVCGDKKQVKSKKEASKTLCRKCYLNQKVQERTRICIDCGDVKVLATSSDAQALRCKKCSSKHIAKLRKGKATSVPKVIYYYFCTDCADIKISKARVRRTRCGKCSRKAKRLHATRLPYFDFKTMKIVNVPDPEAFIRTCQYCGDKKVMKQKSQAGLKACKACSNKNKDLKAIEAKRQDTLKSKGIKIGRKKINKPKKSSKTISKEAIERARQINAEHREAQKNKVEIPKAKMSEEEMINNFLKHNKPSVIADDTFLNITGIIDIPESYSAELL